MFLLAVLLTINLCVSEVKSTIRTISTALLVMLNWTGMHVKFEAVQVSPLTIWTSCTVCAAMTRWEFQFAVPAVVRLKSASLPLWENIGMLSISFALNAKSHSSAIAITRKKDWRTVKLITINFSEIFVSFVIK